MLIYEALPEEENEDKQTNDKDTEINNQSSDETPVDVKEDTKIVDEEGDVMSDGEIVNPTSVTKSKGIFQYVWL